MKWKQAIFNSVPTTWAKMRTRKVDLVRNFSSRRPNNWRMKYMKNNQRKVWIITILKIIVIVRRSCRLVGWVIMCRGRSIIHIRLVDLIMRQMRGYIWIRKMEERRVHILKGGINHNSLTNSEKPVYNPAPAHQRSTTYANYNCKRKAQVCATN